MATGETGRRLAAGGSCARRGRGSASRTGSVGSGSCARKVHRFDTRYLCTLRVGALALFSPEIVNPTNPSDVRGGFSMLPSFDATCTADAYRGPDLRVGANLQLGVVGFANPLLQRVDPRAVVGAGLTMVLPPRTSVAVTASFFTPAVADAVPAGG
jgi:hypothetical protein